MRELILYIASSLDGHIAGKSDEIDWLFHDENYGYDDFLMNIDTILMGRRTFEIVLEFGDYPYKAFQGYVFSQTLKDTFDDNIKIISEDIVNFVLDLKENEGKNIWLMGGSKIIEPLLQKNLIDKFILSIHPIILGEGISLFSDKSVRVELELEKCETFESGLVQLFYARS